MGAGIRLQGDAARLVIYFFGGCCTLSIHCWVESIVCIGSGTASAGSALMVPGIEACSAHCFMYPACSFVRAVCAGTTTHAFRVRLRPRADGQHHAAARTAAARAAHAASVSAPAISHARSRPQAGSDYDDSDPSLWRGCDPYDGVLPKAEAAAREAAAAAAGTPGNTAHDLASEHDSARSSLTSARGRPGNSSAGDNSAGNIHMQPGPPPCPTFTGRITLTLTFTAQTGPKSIYGPEDVASQPEVNQTVGLLGLPPARALVRAFGQKSARPVGQGGGWLPAEVKDPWHRAPAFVG